MANLMFFLTVDYVAKQSSLLAVIGAMLIGPLGGQVGKQAIHDEQAQAPWNDPYVAYMTK